MLRRKTIAKGLIVSLLLSLGACKKSNPGNSNGDPCAGVNITVTPAVTNTDPCIQPSNNGKIEVTASGSSGFSYSIDNGVTFQSSGVFNSLANGTYAIVVKNANGCIANSSATISSGNPGPQFLAAKAIITSKCYPCHNTGGLAVSNANFSTNCNIVSKWDRILARAVNYQQLGLNPMPYVPLSDQEKATLQTWINGGHGTIN